MRDLTIEKAWIFRITHIDNVAWILEHGLHCCNSTSLDPNFRPIGNVELIGKRASKVVPIAPGGTLSDYVPFYFTPATPMLLNIKTGYHGTPMLPMPQIAILVTSLPKVRECGLRFLFTDNHAYLNTARFSGDLKDLDRIDWALLQRRDFSRNPDDPGKFERYQAEAIVHGSVPLSAVLGIACHGEPQQQALQEAANRLSCSIPIIVRPAWYV